MPIELQAFRKGEKQVAVDLGFAAVYVIGTDEKPHAMRLGYAINVARKLHEHQASNPRRLVIHHLAWFPDMALARRVEQATMRVLLWCNIRPGWYDAAPETAGSAILEAAKELSIPVVDHRQYVEMLRAEPGRQQERAMRRLGGVLPVRKPT